MGILTETHKAKIKICLLAKRQCLHRKAKQGVFQTLPLGSLNNQGNPK